PTPNLARAAGAIGHAHIELDTDGVARGLYLYNGLTGRLWPTLSLAAHLPMPKQTQAQLPNYINVREDYRLVPLAGGAGTLPTYSYASVLSHSPSPQEFAGKTVLVGATAAGFGDILPTPFSGLSRPMSGVEFHANVYSASKQNILIVPAEPWVSPALNLLVLLLLSLLLPRLRPAATLLACATIAAGLVSGYVLLLIGARVQLSVANALLMPMAAMPIASALRLAMTNRFLNRQLDEMARTPRLSLPEPSNRHPQQLLTHLRALLHPPGWLLAEQNDLLEVQEMTLAQAPPTETPGRWEHQQNQSWIKLIRGGTDYLLGLTLPNDLSREVIQRYLNQLELEPHVDSEQHQGPRENISARIEKVRIATQKLGEMQAFIRHSFEHMPDGIIVTDELGVIRFANRHIEDWFCEPMPSLSGMPLATLLEGHDPRDLPPWFETVSETLTL